MTRGYDLPSPEDADPGTWDGFEWHPPETYNVATEALDHEQSRTALRHVGVDGDRHTFTYGDIDAASETLAAFLASLGVGAGDRVAVHLPQCPENLLVHLATYRLEAITVPVSMLLGEQAFRHHLSHADVDVLFFDAGSRASLPTDANAVVEHAVSVDPGGYTGRLGALGGLSGVVDRPEAAIGTPTTGPEDPATILYTSGTSGRPKGVLQGHGYLLGSLPGYQCCFHLFDASTCRDALLWTPSEWAWAGALFDVVFPTLAVGGTVLSTERRTGFDPEWALDTVAQASVTHTFFPPTALARVRAEATPVTRDLSALRVVMCGGEKLPPAVFEWGEERLGVTINETYGQTEANILVGNSQRVFEAKPGSMGKAFPGHDVSVVDEDGTRQPPGQLGELAVEPPDPVTFLSYWDDADATAAKFLDDGRMLTGDLARRDEDGYLWHAGRKDELIITSGYRVSPLEVESTLAADPRVDAAVVGGVPDATRGQRIKAYLLLSDGVDPSPDLADEFRNRVRDRLGAHKRPHEVEFLESLPETSSGKADRDALFPD